VPAPPEGWSRPPFSGALADGYVWGRGSLDDKVSVMGILEGVERLLRDGFAPRRTVLLAFGYDEEVGGSRGAAAIAARLRQRGVHPFFSLDEGLAVGMGLVPGVARPVALIGVAEKGYVTLRLRVRARTGHSSIPPAHTAIGRLAAALVRLEAHPFPARIEGPVADMLQAVAPHASFPIGLVASHPRLFGPILRRQLAAEPPSNALIRTTTAVTMVAGGVKENILPPEASALVNFRLAPWDSSESVRRHVREVVDDPGIELEALETTEPSPVAQTDSPSYRLIRDAIEEVMPDALVAPSLVLGGTDTKHYVDLAQNSYRFVPIRVAPADLERIHGVDERLSLASYAEIIDFYTQLIHKTAR